MKTAEHLIGEVTKLGGLTASIKFENETPGKISSAAFHQINLFGELLSAYMMEMPLVADIGLSFGWPGCSIGLFDVLFGEGLDA